MILAASYVTFGDYFMFLIVVASTAVPLRRVSLISMTKLTVTVRVREAVFFSTYVAVEKPPNFLKGEKALVAV